MAQARGKRGGFRLDIDDMERRIVEFRLMLDRERRRCEQAQMTHKFESLLHDKLNELKQQTGGQPNWDQNQNNEIKLTTFDSENSARLKNFLKTTIELCQKCEQQELIQEVLRSSLVEARRKRMRTHQEDPAQAGKPLEPFCLFCASSLDPKTCATASSCNNLDHQHMRPEPICMGPANPPEILDSQTTDRQQDDSPILPRVEVVPVTPPPSNVGTPEVGQQTGFVYTPQPPASPSTPRPQQQPNSIKTQNGTTSITIYTARSQQVDSHAAQTSASSQNENGATNQRIDSVANPNVSATSSKRQSATFVMPSDDDEDELSSNDDVGSVRFALDRLGRSRPLANNPVDVRCSTPLSGSHEVSSRGLVVVYDDARDLPTKDAVTALALNEVASPIKRRSLGAAGLVHHSSVKAPKSTEEKIQIKLQKLSKGPNLSQSSLNDRPKSSTSRGVRRKFRPKRGSNNNSRRP